VKLWAFILECLELDCSIHRRDLCRDFADYQLWVLDSGQDVHVLSIRYIDSTDAFVLWFWIHNSTIPGAGKRACL
jgi:hypothetical protein